MKLRIILFGLLFLLPNFLKAQEPQITEDWSKKPPVITAGKGNKAPSDAIILYNKKADLENWLSQNGQPARWKTRICGLEANRTGSIITKQSFGDAQYHVEWRTPRKVDPEEEGQARGNSGFYIQGKYEVQILDSYENETYYNGQAGSIYKQAAPLVNASRKPGVWQSYDIVFHAPRFTTDGELVQPATITVFHNGVLIQDHFVLKGETVYAGFPKYTAHEEKRPLLLQDHGNPIRFRNIWVREL